MNFAVLGMNHHIAPIEIRECVHFKETQIIEASDRLRELGLDEFIILSTCNRSEIYFLYKDQIQAEDVLDFYLNFFSLTQAKTFCFTKTGQNAILHLFSVASGLDSKVLGEDQILGQVVEAQLTAIQLGTAGKVLNKFFRSAIEMAKKIKSESGISDLPISTAYVGVKQIEAELAKLNENIAQKKALVVGMGEMGRLATEHMLTAGVDVSISNRTYENSLKVIAQKPALRLIKYEDFPATLPEVDIFVTATSSPHLILKKSDLPARTKALYILDLSLPRDVEADVADLAGVKLFDIDSLDNVSRENQERQKEILLAYVPEMEKNSLELLDWLSKTRVDPIMQSLDARCDQVAQETLDYIFRKTDLNHSQKKKVDKIVRSAIKKVAREPVLYLKKLPQKDERAELAISYLEEVYQ